MSSSKVNIDKLSLAVLNELEAYKNVTVEIMTEAVKRTAKETVREIRERAKQAFNSEKNEYANSWAYKRNPDLRGKWRFSMVVYAKDPHYRIAHLLENGHAKVTGGHVDGRPHISPAEQLARENLVKYIAEGIEKA